MPENAVVEHDAKEAADTDIWDQLEHVIETGDSEEVHEFLRALRPGETARLVSQLSSTQEQELIAVIGDAEAAELMAALPELQAAQLLASVPVEQAAHIVNAMESDEQVDLLDQLPDQQSEAILKRMHPEEAASVRFLAEYDGDCAGGLMNTEYLSFNSTLTVDEILNDLREHADEYAAYNVQYLYVVSAQNHNNNGGAEIADLPGESEGRLIGVIPLRDLVLAPRHQPVTRQMIENPISVRDSTHLEDLQRLFDSRPLFGLPVIDATDKLVGVVRRADVEEAGEEQAARTFMRFAGILGGEELRSLPLSIRCKRRLSWLSINIV